MEITGEIIGYCRKISRRLRRAYLPASLDLIQRLQRGCLLGCDHTDLWKVRLGLFYIGLESLVERPLHIRLPGSHPHLSDKQIVHRDLVVAGDLHREWAARFKRFQLQFPLAALCCGSSRLPGELDGDFLAFVSSAPDWDILPALEHSSVGEKNIGLHLSLQ